jgi:NNP family nitrate/nitrite transporter-like MFS transporter
MTAGSSFGIAPYINPKAPGTVTGIVGAGGNVGAICFGLIFRSMDFYWSFIIIGCCAIMSSFTCSLMYIPSHGNCSRNSSEMAVDLTESFAGQRN